MPNIDYKTRRFYAIEPDECPFCHSKCVVEFEYGYFSENENFEECFYGVYKCPAYQCGRKFVTEYIIHFHQSELYNNRFLSGTPNIPKWPPVILELFSGFLEDSKEPELSKFISTYMQSIMAENHGLNEIAGMGYRKAIEYLVKDVAARDFPEKKEEIKKFFLKDVINNFYTGEIKELLERATWLGNDQSHYFKLFEEYDVNTIKELIELIVSELDTAYRKKKYIENIQNQKGKK